MTRTGADGFGTGHVPTKAPMTPDAEALGSWAVEINLEEKSSLVLVLNGRRLRLPRAAAEMLSRALHERCVELAASGNNGPANLP